MQVIAFVGGGTGGHVYPGLATIEALSQRGQFRFIWIGSQKGIERRLIEDSGLEYHAISSGKLRRYWSWQNISDLFRVVLGLIQSFRILKKNRPVFVFSKGGFVSVPVVWAAWIRKIPVFSHESDVDPGLATKLNLPCSQKMFVPYQESVSFYPQKHRHKVVVTGNPVRRKMFSSDRLSLRSLWKVPQNLPVILIMGGSLGAKEINDLVKDNKKHWEGRFFVVHQTGENKPLEQTPWYVSAPYFKEVHHLYAGADLLISRAGAGTLWEASCALLPMVLIPLVQGSRGDQVRNARLFAQAGAAFLLKSPISSSRLNEAIEVSLTLEQRTKAKAILATFRAKQAAFKIADEIVSTLSSVLT